jgi:Flp pilus assembly protein TadG
MDPKCRALFGPRRGQTLVFFTLMMTAFVTFLAVVVDLGFLYGQRRYDQNGADAAALAVGRDLATNVTPSNQSGTAVYFAVTDAEAYKLARQYGGLDPNTTTTSPTGTNQNANLDSTNQLKISLEYAPDGSTWCYSPAGPQPPRQLGMGVTAVPVCSSTIPSYPPPPTSLTNPYKIRVTVSSTTASSFLSFLGNLSPGPPPPTNTQANAGQAACIRPTGVTGMLTCAQTVVSIAGTLTYHGTGPAVPITACDTQLGVGTVGQMYPLWTSNPGTTCGIKTGNWKQTFDFTASAQWCDGIGPDYLYTSLLPAPCAAADTTWNRGGFVADASNPGTGLEKNDVPMWLSLGFSGTLTTTMMLPTYQNDGQANGSEGQNIAIGVYCDNTVTKNTCPGNTPSGTYLFAQNQTGFHATCPDDFGIAYGVGCRDVTVPTWITPEAAGTCNPGKVPCWQAVTGTGAPDRVEIANFRQFRIYCSWGTANGDQVCNGAPSAVPGAATGTSTVSGRYLGPFLGNCDPATCNQAPNLNGVGVEFGG